MPRMLLDIQNRGQLSAGITTYNPERKQLLETHKDVGSVSEVFRMSHRGKYESLMKQYAGRAAIGHVRYATCGEDDRNYAQPFERHHLQKHKWFSFGFNGQLANYRELQAKLLADGNNHLARENDTEIIMHEISRELSGDNQPDLVDVFRNIAKRFDGAYNLVFLNALGEMVVVRDPLGIRPLCYAKEGHVVCRGQRKRGAVESWVSGRKHQIAVAGADGRAFRPSGTKCTRLPAAATGALLFRMDLFRQRRQHDGRAERVSDAQTAGRRAGAVGNGDDR